MRFMHVITICMLMLAFMVPSAMAEDGIEEDSMILEMLESVALISLVIAMGLSVIVAIKLGGEIGKGLKLISIALICYGGIPELMELIFGLSKSSLISETFEIIGGIGLLIGFYLLYKATK